MNPDLTAQIEAVLKARGPDVPMDECEPCPLCGEASRHICYQVIEGGEVIREYPGPE